MLRDNARRGNGFVPLTPLGHGVWKGARRVPKRGPRCNPVAGTKPRTKPTRTAYDTSNDDPGQATSKARRHHAGSDVAQRKSGAG